MNNNTIKINDKYHFWSDERQYVIGTLYTRSDGRVEKRGMFFYSDLDPCLQSLAKFVVRIEDKHTLDDIKTAHEVATNKIREIMRQLNIRHISKKKKD